MSEYIVGAKKEDLERLKREEKKTFTSGKGFLQNTKVSTLFPEKRIELVTFNSTDSLGRAFKTLVDNKILSAPVYEEKIRQYTSFIDVLDIVFILISQVTKEEVTSYRQLEEITKRLDNFTVGQVAAKSGRNPYYAVDESAPVLVAMELMAQHKMHRIPVIESKDLSTVVTQSHVIKMIYDNIKLFSIASKTVDDLQLGLKDVISVKDSELLLGAFKQIQSLKISGIAVVNDKGELVGNVSASDVKYVSFSAGNLARLYLPIYTFLKQIQELPNSIPGPHCVLPNATIEEVLAKFILTHSHRLYVVSKSKIPIGVISMVDLIEKIVKYL